MSGSVPSSTNNNQQTTSTTSSSNSQQNANPSGQIQFGQSVQLIANPEQRSLLDAVDRLREEINTLVQSRQPQPSNSTSRNTQRSTPPTISYLLLRDPPPAPRNPSSQEQHGNIECQDLRASDSNRSSSSSSAQQSRLNPPSDQEQQLWDPVNDPQLHAWQPNSPSSNAQQPRPSSNEIRREMERVYTSYFTRREQQTTQLFQSSSSQSSSSTSSIVTAPSIDPIQSDEVITRAWNAYHRLGQQAPTDPSNHFPSFGRSFRQGAPAQEEELFPRRITSMAFHQGILFAQHANGDITVQNLSDVTPTPYEPNGLVSFNPLDGHNAHVPTYPPLGNGAFGNIPPANPPSSAVPGPKFTKYLKLIQNAVPDETLKSFDVSSLKADKDLKDTIARWLRKLTTMAAEYLNPRMRPLFCTRVLSILYFATQNREFLKEILPETLAQAVGTCGDDAAEILNELELKKKIVEGSDSSLAYIVKLLKGGYKMAKLKEFGSRFITDKKSKEEYVDDVSVHLGLQVLLRDALELPVDCQDLSHLACSGLTEIDLNKAKEEVNEAAKNIDNLVGYFLMEKTWVNRLKKEFSQELNAAIATLRAESEALDERAFNQEIGDEEYVKQSNALRDKCNNLEPEWLKNKTIELLKNL